MNVKNTWKSACSVERAALRLVVAVDTAIVVVVAVSLCWPFCPVFIIFHLGVLRFYHWCNLIHHLASTFVMRRLNDGFPKLLHKYDNNILKCERWSTYRTNEFISSLVFSVHVPRFFCSFSLTQSLFLRFMSVLSLSAISSSLLLLLSVISGKMVCKTVSEINEEEPFAHRRFQEIVKRMRFISQIYYLN